MTIHGPTLTFDEIVRLGIELQRPIRVGKKVRGAIYLHSSVLARDDRMVGEYVALSGHNAPLNEILLRLDKGLTSAAILHYPGFLDKAHPALCCSTLVKLTDGSSKYRSYQQNANRPILHRKELLVSQTHPFYNTFKALTECEERLGLLRDFNRIGWSDYWVRILSEKGLRIVGHSIERVPSQFR